MGKDFGLARVHLIETALGEGRGDHLDELIDERLATRMSEVLRHLRRPSTLMARDARSVDRMA